VFNDYCFVIPNYTFDLLKLPFIIIKNIVFSNTYNIILKYTFFFGIYIKITKPKDFNENNLIFNNGIFYS
jgi:hypothetical protein